MTARSRLRAERVPGVFDGLVSFGVCVLLFGLPLSEALKTAGLALAALGIIGGLLVRGRSGRVGRDAPAAASAASPVSLSKATLAALAVYFVAGALSVAFAREELRKWMILAGAAVAAVIGYGEYMLGASRRLSLPSVENAVAAAEYLAAALAMAAAMLIHEGPAPIAGPLLALITGCCAIALVMTKSRGPLLGGAVGVAVAVAAGLRRKRYAFLVLAVVAVSAVLFASTHPDSRFLGHRVLGTRAAHIRASVWSQTVDLIRERPVLGHGLGTYSHLGVTYRDERTNVRQSNAHSSYLHAACEAGLIGAGALLAFLVLGVRDIVRARRRLTRRLDRSVAGGALAGVVVLAVAGIFSVTVDAEPGMLLFALAALGASYGLPGPAPAHSGSATSEEGEGS